MDFRQWLTTNDENSAENNKLYEERQLCELFASEMKKETINMLEYTYLIQFVKKKNIMINSDWFTELILKITISYDGAIDIKQLVSVIFDNKISHNMEFDVDKMTKEFVEEKKNKFGPTNDQKKGVTCLCKFLKDHTRSMFGMYGYAGTGKTTTITEILHFLLHTKNIKSVAFTAPTNKAVNICKSKFRSHVVDLYNSIIVDDGKEKKLDDYIDKLSLTGIKIDFITIHRLLNYKNDFDLQGERIFIKGNDNLLGNYDIVIVDECSMIPLKIINDITCEVTKDIKLTDNYIKVPKIIFIGDPAQLPPVNETTSSIFIKNKDDLNLHDYMLCNDIKMDTVINGNEIIEENKDNMMRFASKIINIDTITFTHIVRNNNDTINNLCNEIRRWVYNETKQPNISKYIDNDFVKLYPYDKNKKDKTKTKWFKRYLKELDNGTNNIILTWTNKQMDVYNDAARSYMFYKDPLKKNKIMDEYVINDVLILNDFYNFEESSSGAKFYTSEQIKVLNVNELTVSIGEIADGLNKSISKIKNFNVIRDVYQKYINKINNKTRRKYKVWKLNVVRLCEHNVPNVIPVTHDIMTIHHESRYTLDTDKRLAMEIIKEMRNEMKSKFKSQIKTIDRAIIKRIWKEWSKIFIDQFANVNYGFTITSHKSQGSTFYNVYVDCDDILNNNNNNEAKRCMYTSFTRASNKIKLLI